MNASFKFILSTIGLIWLNALWAEAQPLQGFARQTEILTRIQRPSLANNMSSYADQAQPQTSLVKMNQFKDVLRPLTPANQPIMSKGRWGEDEYWVSWDTWRSRIADAVWGPLKERKTIMWGMTRVDYDVSRDHHIQIISVHTPDPSGKSGKILAAAIMQLNGKSVLSFPSGSKQNVHHNFNMDMALPIPGPVRHTIHLRGDTEHVITSNN